MKTALLLFLCLPLFFIGCASTGSTMLWHPTTGAKLAQFPSDMDESEYNGGGVYWRVRGHRPSRTIEARGRAYSKVIGTVGEQAGTFQGVR